MADNIDFCLLLFLLAAVRTGEGLLCYESTCAENLTSCTQDHRTILKECTFETFRQTVENLDSPYAFLGFGNHSMMCITHGAEGVTTATGRTQDIMLRLCFPEVAGVCDFLTKTTDAVFRGHGIIVKSGCHFCQLDGCNKPPPAPEEFNASVHNLPLLLLLILCLVVARS